MILLIKKYINGLTSLEEDKKLETWIQKNPENLNFFKEQIRLAHRAKKQHPEIFDQEDAFKKIMKTGVSRTTDTSISKNSYKYAAVIIVLLCSSLLAKILLFEKPSSHTNIFTTEKLTPNNHTVLTLEDGSIQILDGNITSSNVDQKNQSYMKPIELSYIGSITKENQPLQYHTITVPKGKKFKLFLSDKTAVWLNAESKLRFPKKFLKTEDSRTVFLEGEAFFDVTKDTSRPFIVKTNEMDVKVLGTRFNVSSYSSDTSIKTTLVEGSVQIQDKNSNQSLLELVPGDQANFDKENKKADKYPVDIDTYISWMKNRLVFSEERFDQILKRIERTYNVVITNEYSQINNQKFTGEFDIESTDDIMKVLSISASFDYTINKNQITIRKK